MIIGNPVMYAQLPIEDALVRMKKLGFQGIELNPAGIWMCTTESLQKQLTSFIKSLGLSLVRLNASAADYFTPFSHPADWPRILENLKTDIDLAAGLGIGQLVTWEGEPHKSHSQKDIHGWVLDATTRLFEQALAYAAERNVRLSVDVHPSTMGMDIGWLIKLCDRLDPKAFSVTFDCAHFAIGHPGGYVDAIRALDRRIGHLRLADSDMVSYEVHFPPGTGKLDLVGIIRALKAIRFKGTCMLDLWGYPMPTRGAQIGIPYLKKIMKVLGIAQDGE